MLSGAGLGVLAPLLGADANGRAAYAEMTTSEEFRAPVRWADIDVSRYAAVLLPGGHAPGMRPYLESATLQRVVVDAFARGLVVAAICHGVLVAARARDASGRSPLHGRRTTCLLASQERAAWMLTRAWLGDYYRTYPALVEDEVREQLANPAQLERGPLPLRRDAPGQVGAGFVVRDGQYLSARWPGDAHRFAETLLEMLTSTRTT